MTSDDADVDVRALLNTAQILDIQQAGTAAARAGKHVTMCPYRSPQTPIDKARRQMWIAGYSAGRTELRQAAEGVAEVDDER